jgi:hypothetical protein
MSDLHPALSGFELAVDEATAEIPEDFQLRMTEAAAKYLNHRWRVEISLKLREQKENAKMNEKPETISESTILEQDMLDELRMIALCLAEAATTRRKRIMRFRWNDSQCLTSYQVEQTGKYRHMPML